MKNMHGQMDGQTGVFLYSPQDFVCGGYNKKEHVSVQPLI